MSSLKRKKDSLGRWAASTPGQQKLCFSTTKEHNVSLYDGLGTFFNL